MAVVKKKTVNRTGKKLIEKALVVKAKAISKITAEGIKKINEKVLKQKLETRNEKLEIETRNEKLETGKELKQHKKDELRIGLKD